MDYNIDEIRAVRNILQEERNRRFEQLRCNTPNVYHYTDFSAFEQIVSRDHLSFRATQIHYMNDTQEYDELYNRIDEILKEDQASESVLSLLNEVRKNPIQSDSTLIFACCFSENGDQLSQWRGYAQKGMGASVGISCEAIETSFASENGFVILGPDRKQYCDMSIDVIFSPCIYDPDEQKRMIVKLVESIIPMTPSSQIVRRHLYYLAPFFKNSHFEEEREWRISITNPYPEIVQYRNGKTTLIPYLNIQLNTSPNKIVVGPNPNMGLAINAVFQLLTSRALITKVNAIPSKIPFRTSV